MIFLPLLLNVIVSLHSECIPPSQKPDPCEEAKKGAAAATLFAKDSLYYFALTNIKAAFAADRNEHCISFGKDTAGNIIASLVSGGSATRGKAPANKPGVENNNR